MKPPLPDRAALANQAQMLLLDALLANTRFSCPALAFQGGTSLKLMAGSPRFSEDLDFLLREDHSERLIETPATAAAFCRDVADALPHVKAARGRAAQNDGPAP